MMKKVFNLGKKVVSKTIKALLYAGVSRSEYDSVKHTINKTNRTMTTVLSFFATILIGCMFITSLKTDALAMNRDVYAIGTLLSLAVFVLSLTIAKKFPATVSILVYLSYAIFYIYGIMIGIVSDPDGKTVTFMVMIVFMQILFVDRPVHSITFTGIFIFVFIGLCYKYKQDPVMSIDVTDALVFGILGASSSTVMNTIKVRRFHLEETLRAVKLVDQLTNLKDGKAYAIEQKTIVEKCRTSLACVFVDVNGLHQINNEQGHDAGDRMLQTIANEIKDVFTAQYAYRIGGDEFVVFIPEANDAEILTKISRLKAQVEESNYYIAVGYSFCEGSKELKHLSIEDFVKDADAFMFKDKARFYKNKTNGDRDYNDSDIEEN